MCPVIVIKSGMVTRSRTLQMLSLFWYGNHLFISRRNVWLTSTYHFVYNNGIYAIRILLLWPAYILLSGHWHMKIYSFFFINGNLLQNITPTHIRTDENSQYYNKSKAGKVFHTLNYMLHLLSSLICWMQRRRDKNLLFASLTQTRTHLHTTL